MKRDQATIRRNGEQLSSVDEKKHETKNGVRRYGERHVPFMNTCSRCMDLHFGVFSDNPYTRRIILEGISIISNYPNDVDNNLRDVNLFINTLNILSPFSFFLKFIYFVIESQWWRNQGRSIYASSLSQTVSHKIIGTALLSVTPIECHEFRMFLFCNKNNIPRPIL